MFINTVQNRIREDLSCCWQNKIDACPPDGLQSSTRTLLTEEELEQFMEEPHLEGLQTPKIPDENTLKHILHNLTFLSPKTPAQEQSNIVIEKIQIQ